MGQFAQILCVKNTTSSSTTPAAPLPLAVRVLETFGQCLSYLPTSVVFPFARSVGRLVSRLFPREQQISVAQVRFANKHLQFIGNASPEEIYRRSFGHLFQCLAEVFLFSRLLRRDPRALLKYASGEGADTDSEVRDKVRAILAISGHIGNFELLAAFHAISGNRVTVIGREPNHSALSVFVDRVRTAYGAQSIWRHGRAAASIILRALKDGRSLAVLLDQDTNLANSFAPFFGLDAASPKAAIELAVRNKLPIITSFLIRTGHMKFTVFTEWIEYDPHSPTVNEDVLTVYNQRLEKLIAQYPEQWLWWHRRWRRRPEVDYEAHPEQLRSTKDYIAWLDSQ